MLIRKRKLFGIAWITAMAIWLISGCRQSDGSDSNSILLHLAFDEGSGTNVFTGPSAFLNPQMNELLLFCIMQDQRNPAYQGAAGWAHNVGLTRKIYLDEQGLDVKMEPIDEMKALEKEILIQETDLSLEEAKSNVSRY